MLDRTLTTPIENVENIVHIIICEGNFSLTF